VEKGDILTESQTDSNPNLLCKSLKLNKNFYAEKFLKNLTRRSKLLMFQRNIQLPGQRNFGSAELPQEGPYYHVL
jgi:hypothetical protein|tara:strand:- start:264 stop:488 length:225 start_codon:yes stop_codon:yes gene_type:complete